MRRIIILMSCLFITVMLSLSFAADQTTNQDQQKAEAEQSQVMKKAKSLPSTLLTDKAVKIGEESAVAIDEEANPWETQYNNIPSDID